jgi:hypothetical protein
VIWRSSAAVSMSNRIGNPSRVNGSSAAGAWTVPQWWQNSARGETGREQSQQETMSPFTVSGPPRRPLPLR